MQEFSIATDRETTGDSDESARFAALVREHHAKVCNFIHRHTGNRQDAEDLTQDTFVKAFRHFHRFDESQGSFTAWLYTIARRTMYNHHRDRRPTQELNFEIPVSPDDSGADRVSERCAQLWHQVRQLKPPYQEVILLKYSEELSIEEIARILNRSQTGVKILLFRARHQLRKLSPNVPLQA